MKELKKLLSILLAMIMLLACIPLCAVSAEVGGVYGGMTYEIVNNEVTITGHTDDVPEHLVIPATIEGYPVTAIGRYAFNGDYEGFHIVSIVVPEGVRTIGEGAFSGPNTLVSVKLPDTVTAMGERAFWYSGVQEVNIPKGITTIERATFMGTNIKSITIPDSVTTIGEEAFYGCKLTSVVISDSVTFIGNHAFQCCSNLTSVVLPNRIETIPWYSFSECYALTSIVIPDSVKTIEEGAFCEVPLEEIVIPDSVTVIENYAFVAGDSLTAVTLSKNIEKIDAGAFAGCSSLSDVYYGKGEEDRANIIVGDNNDPLHNATWHYNCINPKDHYSADVQHSVMETENGNGLAFKFELSASVNFIKKNKLDLTDATINYLGETCKLVGVGAVVTNQEEIIPNLDDVNGKTVIDIPTVYLTDWELDACAFAVRIVNTPESALDRIIYARPYYIIEVEGEQLVVYGEINSACASAYMA